MRGIAGLERFGHASCVHPSMTLAALSVLRERLHKQYIHEQGQGLPEVRNGKCGQKEPT